MTAELEGVGTSRAAAFSIRAALGSSMLARSSLVAVQNGAEISRDARADLTAPREPHARKLYAIPQTTAVLTRSAWLRRPVRRHQSAVAPRLAETEEEQRAHLARKVGRTRTATALTRLKLRTDRDLPINFVLIGVIALVVVIAFASPLYVGGTGIAARIAAAIMIIVFGFLFVTVSSRLTGEIGSSSNPISGMTVATLLLTCLTFVILGWTGSNYFVTALSIGAIVCIAASNGGTTSQDLKTGFLIGSTPRNQQIAILIGATVSALALGPILLKLNAAGSVYVPVGTTIQGLPTGGVQPGEKADVSTLHRREKIEGTSRRQARTTRNISSGIVRTPAAATPRNTWWMTPALRCISSIAESTE